MSANPGGGWCPQAPCLSEDSWGGGMLLWAAQLGSPTFCSTFSNTFLHEFVYRRLFYGWSMDASRLYVWWYMQMFSRKTQTLLFLLPSFRPRTQKSESPWAQKAYFFSHLLHICLNVINWELLSWYKIFQHKLNLLRSTGLLVFIPSGFPVSHAAFTPPLETPVRVTTSIKRSM